MKYMITAALALCLLGGAAAAQERDHDRGRGPEGRQAGGEEHRGGGPAAARQAPVAPQAPTNQQRGFRAGPQAAPQAAAPGPGGPPRAEDRRGPGPGFSGDRRDFRGPGPGGERRDGIRGGPDRSRGPEPGFRPGFYLRDHGWRGGGRFRGPSYRYPSGFGYQRWGFGAYLPFAFLAPDYFLGSYWTYGLPAPPPGYHWIRVGPDALLVRYGDGYVLDAVYGIFY